MLMLIARAPVPDAAYWPGRRLLALVDAVLWPALLAIGVANVPLDTGIVGRVGLGLCALSAVQRAVRAGWRNERYRFTTLRVGLPLAALLGLGLLLKLAV